MSIEGLYAGFAGAKTGQNKSELDLLW